MPPALYSRRCGCSCSDRCWQQHQHQHQHQQQWATAHWIIVYHVVAARRKRRNINPIITTTTTTTTTPRKTTDRADRFGNRGPLCLAIALLQNLTPVRADEGRHRRLDVYDQHRRLAGVWPTLPVWCEWLPSLSTTTTMTTTTITYLHTNITTTTSSMRPQRALP
ncbi:hypothetical protein CMUS01_16141 [Colletotrichum musicola]|uniref:Uncharacterized protein n=1 Tax=Colletotrichum musicola TaxID=2175873 RepID=A0A8H6IRM3_9PEZI|nr:hypothetical protein CMUS01_16141 [Colletotrichum musicola]